MTHFLYLPKKHGKGPLKNDFTSSPPGANSANLFFEHNVGTGQKDHFRMDANQHDGTRF